jgi:hypothetical protein
MKKSTAGGIAVLAVAVLAAFALSAQADPAAKWRIEFGSYARSDGALTLRISPEGGTPVDVETKITARSSADKAAKALRDSLKTSLGAGYDVETDDGEDVIVRAASKTPKFEVSLGSSTVAGLSVAFHKE